MRVWLVIFTWSGLTTEVKAFDTEDKALAYVNKKVPYNFENVCEVNDYEWHAREYGIYSAEIT